LWLYVTIPLEMVANADDEKVDIVRGMDVGGIMKLPAVGCGVSGEIESNRIQIESF
jgi:hypothetical protein